MKELVTFFTPTYNRAHILHRCYESMCNQESYDFKWLIIDDGSTDNTRELAEKWVQDEKRFTIEYVYKTNGGLYTAYNTAIERVDTELFVCFESDDIFEPNAITIIKKNWEWLKTSDLVGLITPCKDLQGNVIGGLYPEDMKTTYFYNHRKKVRGDKQYIYKTEMLKKVAPMPVFDGEKHFNPTYMFHLLDKYGKMGISNEIFDIVDYQPEGMTASVLKQYYNSPNGFAELRKIYMCNPGETAVVVYKQNIHFVAEYCLARKLRHVVTDSPKPLYTVLAFIPGLMLAGYIKLKN